MNIVGTAVNGDLIVTMTQNEFNTITSPHPPPKGIVLPYAHVSQTGAGAAENRNDCGSACVVSCAREHGYPNLTVDEVSTQHQRPDMPMHIHEVRAALGAYGLANGYQRPLTTIDIAAHIIENELPVITLVSYHMLPYHAPGYEHYHYAHYILVYGVQGNSLLYHDTLSDGRELAITFEQMKIALKSEGNLPDQGILLI